MIHLVREYLDYIATQKRYSARTSEIYESVLEDFRVFDQDESDPDAANDDVNVMLKRNRIRSYQVFLMEEKGHSPRTVNLHLSVLSAFCRYLVKQGILESNPVSLVTRPKQPKRIPVFFKDEPMNRYMAGENALSRRDFEIGFSDEKDRRECYGMCLSRIIVSLLYCTGMRRSELIGLKISDVDFGRQKLHVLGKGNKMREIPLIDSQCEEISLYLQSVDAMVGCQRSADEPLLVTEKGKKLYPMYVDRVIKSELGGIKSITGRKSPHVLRHTLATELLNDGADLYSIKELLGHSSLAATQVYTHNSIEKLKNVYNNAHPRAKSGGNYGDPD